MSAAWRCLVFALSLLVAFPVWTQAQQQGGGGGGGGAEVVRGVVRGPDQTPVAGARVTVTGLQTFIQRSTTTNSKGQYTVLFGEPEGTYVVAVSAIGFAPMTWRVRRGGASSPLLVVDVALAVAAVQLDSLLVLGRGPKRDSLGPAGQEQDLLGGKLFSLDPSSVNSLLARVPGLAPMPGIDGRPGYSALGASPDQNSVLLDGTPFAGGSIPPGMLESAGLATTTYNASRGNFAGGQVSLRTRAGGNRFTGSVDAQLAHPSLAWSDPHSSDPVNQTFNWNGNVSGPIKQGVANYNFGLSQNTESHDFVSLLSLNDLQREQSGISTDTLVALRNTLANLGVPVTTDQVPEQYSSRNRSAMLRLDLVPSGRTTLTVSGNFNDTRQLGSDISTRGFPSLGSGSTSRNLWLQASLSSYLGGFIDQLSTSLQSGSSNSGPYVALPTGNVRLGAIYPGGTGFTDVAFGGGTAGQSRNRTRQWTLNHEMSRPTANNRHQFFVGQSLSFSWSRATSAAAPFGAFTYQTLDDLAANRPASYNRTLSFTDRSTATATSAVWLRGESSLAPNRFRLEYGMRFDFDRAATRPQYNPVIDSLFGRRTDQVPSAMGLSPRLGFNWSATKGGQSADGLSWRSPITITGGVGAFRGVIPSSRVAGLADATGLPNSIRQLTCVGGAVPVPDWNNFAGQAIPTECLDGAAPAEFSTSVPNVQLFNPAYRPPTSWRGDLSIGGLMLAGWGMQVSGAYSRTVNGEGGIDLNLRRTPVFGLPQEGDRPVYVPPDGIVPTSGVIAPGASRLTDRFGPVTDYVSDLGARSFQVSVQLSRQQGLFGKIPVSVYYTYNRTQNLQRGLDGSTAGDPFVREWARDQSPTHQFQFMSQFGVPYLWLTVMTGLSSGQVYTPMISQDVNGDGRSNDRAFIFDPATIGDPLFAQQMRDLLATVTPSTRDCLVAQFGRIAGRNSCRTGWRLQPDVRFDLRPPGVSDANMRRSALGQRVQFSLTTTNLMGTLLHVLGMSNTSLNVLSGASYPLDPTLLYVNGFDSTAREFRYRVNQQFGEGRPQRFQKNRTSYTGAFRVQLGMRVQLGHFERYPSMVQRLGFVSNDGAIPPPTEAEIRERLRKLTESPVSMVLALRDSLLLTDEQIARIEARQAAFTARADSLMSPVVAYVIEHGRKTKDNKLQKLIWKAQKVMYPLMREVLAETVAELNETQQQRVPLWLRQNAAQATKGKGKKK